MLTRLSGTFSGFEAGKVVLTLEDGQKLKIPKEDLQPLPEVGAEFTLQVLPASEAALSQAELSRVLLNQILGDATEKS